MSIIRVRFQNPTPYLFYLVFFFLPFLIISKTSELFEFNKIVLVYLITLLILFFWVLNCITSKKIIFKRTVLDLPILLFLLSQALSTLFSIDTRSSIFGYYGRFNGGLLSLISYAILYFGFVTFVGGKHVRRIITLLLISGLLVSFWGIFEHFGKSLSCFFLRGNFEVLCWEQDVQNRIFATFGQPNWLAAYLIAIIPLAWVKAIGLKPRIKSIKFIFWSFVSIIFFVALLFTKSRSGLLGFLAAFVIFWGYLFFKNKKAILKHLLLTTSYLLLTTIIIGTPWTPNIKQLFETRYLVEDSRSGTALETGGTESGELRKIVWRGAVDIWRNYPIFGTGPETFAHSYFRFRPVEHNLTSEWDFSYNKAHNEFLNYLSNSGIVGFGSYIILVLFSLKKILENKGRKPENLALAAGYISILVTNFFGFSVVTTSLLFFLFPGFAVALGNSKLKAESLSPIKQSLDLRFKKLSVSQRLSSVLALSLMLYAIFCLAKYWYADTLYAEGRSQNDEGNFLNSQEILIRAVELSPNEPLYWLELAESSKGIAIELAEKNAPNEADGFAEGASDQAEFAESLSPSSPSIKRIKAIYYTDLATIQKNYLLMAQEDLIEAISLAPTDPKLYYSLAITSYRMGLTEYAKLALTKAVELKPDFEDAVNALKNITFSPR